MHFPVMHPEGRSCSVFLFANDAFKRHWIGMPDFVNQERRTVYEPLTANVADVFFLLLNRDISLC